jgi:hypothetical protein
VLAGSRAEALLYRQLATLVEDAPIAKSLGDIAWAGVPRRKFFDWCDRLAVTDLRDRPARWVD